VLGLAYQLSNQKRIACLFCSVHAPSSPSLKTFARFTPPASGETTTGVWRSLSWKYWRATGAAYTFSVAVRGPKKPCIQPTQRVQNTQRTGREAQRRRHASSAIGLQQRARVGS
jgi:hypothetical protein